MKNKELIQCTKEIVVAMIESKYIDGTYTTVNENVSAAIKNVYNVLKELNDKDNSTQQD